MKAKKRGGGQLQTKNQIRVVTCKMGLFLLYFVNYMIFIISKCFMKKIIVTFVYNFALTIFYFRGTWFQTPKNRGRSKKTQGRTALKNGGGSLAVGSYLQRGSAPIRGGARGGTDSLSVGSDCGTSRPPILGSDRP